MGNQRRIIQTEPFRCDGAVVMIRLGEVDAIQKILSEPRAANGGFYTYFEPSGKPIEFWNLDAEKTLLPPSPRDHFVIQSGGKMGCWYDNFIEHVRRLAHHCEDAVFYVGDSEQYIDRFRISNGYLAFERVHQGYWYHLETYLNDFGSPHERSI